MTTQREQTNSRCRLQYAVGMALLESRSHRDTVPAILRAICETMGWCLGEAWLLDPTGEGLRLIEAWHEDSAALARFVSFGRQLFLSKGAGLPGLVWQEQRVCWLPSLSDASLFPRSEAAATAGLRIAIGFPLRDQGRFVGVAFFADSQITPPDGELLASLEALGALVGQSLLFNQAIAELDQSEKSLRMIFDSSPFGMALMDSQSRLLKVNPALAEMAGYEGPELGGMTLESLTHPDDRDRSARIFRELLAGDRSSIREEKRYLGKGGKDIWTHVSATLLPERVGAPRVVLAMIEDITARKRTEAKLAHKREALERANQALRDQNRHFEAEVRRRTHELAEANLRLQEQATLARQSDALKTQFLNTLSHEFKTPLTIITGSVELLTEGLFGAIAPEQRESLNRIRWSAQSLQHMVSDLLDMSQIQAGSLMLLRRPIELEATVQQALSLLAPQAGEKEIRVGMAFEPDLPLVVADDQRIIQVLLNLVGNAIKFTPVRGRIDLRVWREPDRVVCEVADTGIGIGPEDHDRLFEPFVQLKAGQEKRGTGLGLGICKALVEAHGGTIGVESTLGSGSRFWFALPL
ncbi:MAG TPA: ATP-binding protein [Pantanalinema sp.]